MARKQKKTDIYRGRDPREIPTYGIFESAHLLKIPPDTLRSWVHGRDYPTDRGTKRSEPLITLPDENLSLLSFVNLVEAHVLDAIRYKHDIPMESVRNAVDHLRERYGSKHPLAEFWFQQNGVDLIIEEAGQLVSVSRLGQLAMREIIKAYLRRIERDPQQAAVALYPYLSRHPRKVEDEPKVILIDPRISFGKAILVGVGVPTAVIVDRHDAGETIEELANDYGCEASDIKKAIDYERALPKAA